MIRSARTLLLSIALILVSTLHAFAVSSVLDSSFAIGTGAGFPTPGAVNWGQVEAVAVQPDGKVLAGGQSLFTDFNGTPVKGFCRINVDGTLDTTFLANVGSGPSDGSGNEVNSIVIQPDGKILVGGPFTTFNGVSRSGIARLNADGTLDNTSLATGGGVGWSPFRYLTSISLQSDGKVLIAGGFASYLGTSRPCIARLNSDGSLDTSFDPGIPAGLGTTKVANAVAVDQNGKVYVGGNFTNWFGLITPGIVRLQSNGVLDGSFAPTIRHSFPSVGTINPLDDGRILIGGTLEGNETGTTRNLARFNSNGTIDNTYAATVDGLVMTVSPWPAGGHLIGGRFRAVNGQPRGELALLDDSGNLDATFAPAPVTSAQNDLVHIYTTAVAPDGKIVVGGWFTNYPNSTQLNGKDYSGIARFVGGFTGGAGTIQFSSATRMVNEDAGTVTLAVTRFGGSVGAVGVSIGTIAGTATANSDYTTTNGVLSWAAGETGTKTFKVTIVNDAFAEASENLTVRLTSPTGGAVLGSIVNNLITIVDNDSLPSVEVAPQNQSVYIGYDATFQVFANPGPTVAYQWRSNGVLIASATNSFLTLVNVQTNFASTYSVILSNKVGSITNAGASLTVLVPAGLPEPSFVVPGVGFNQDVYDLLFQPDGALVAVGGFNQYGGVTIAGSIARLNADGSRDVNFPPSGVGANSLIQNISQYPDGRFLISGAFTQYSGTNRSKVARLLPTGALDLTFSNNTSSSTIYAAIPQADGSALIADGAAIRHLLPSGSNDTAYALTGLSGTIYAMAQQADGKVIAAPYRSISGVFGSELVRLNLDGTRDFSFRSPGRFTGGLIQSMKVLVDGRILVAGTFTSLATDAATNALPYIAIVTPAGTVDPSFDIGNTPDNGIIDTFVQTDGRILVSGAFSTWNGVAVGRYLRLLPDGKVDPSFISGTGADNFVRAVSMDPTGRIGIGGSFTTVNGQAKGKVAVLTQDAGSIQFQSSFTQVNEQAGVLTVSVLRGGGSRGPASVNYTTLAGTATASDFTAASGTLSWAAGEVGAKTFNITINNDAIVETDELFSVYLSNFVGATSGLYTNLTIQILDNESPPRFNLQPASFVAAEDVNVTFSSDAFSALPITYQWRSNNVNIPNATGASLTLSNVQTGFAASYSVRVSNSVNFIDSTNAVLQVVLSPTRRDTTFNPPVAFNGPVRAVFPLGDGRVLVGGDFTQPRSKIVLLNSSGAVDASFTATASSASGIPGVYDIERDGNGRFLIVGLFTQFGAANATNIVRLNPDFSIDTSFLTALGNHPNGLVRDVAVGPDGKIWIAGDFTSVGGPYGLQNVVRLNDNGSVDLTFLPHAGNPVYRVIPLAGGGAYLGGNFSSYDGFGGYLRRCLANGNVDRTFSPSVPGVVFDMTLRADGSLYAVGSFSTPTSRSIRIKPNGVVDSIFLEGVTASDNAYAVLAQSNGRVAIGGAFISMGIHSNRFTRVNLDGTQDSSISIGTGFGSGDVLKLAQEYTGQIWVGGAFATYKGSGPGYLVRLLGEDPLIGIGKQPVDATVAPGQSVSFSASVAGGGMLTYQWLKDGVPIGDGGVISGALTSTLTLTGVSLANEGSYSLVISNGLAASAITRPARLLVRGIPVIVSQPAGGFVPAGSRIQLDVGVEGAPALAYQWYRDTTPVGVNAPVYVQPGAGVSASGNYVVVVGNASGSVTSIVATVTVQTTPATTAPGFFSDAGPVNVGDTVNTLLPLPDGRLMAGGIFSSVKTNGATSLFRANLALFNTNGMGDPFNPGPDGQINDIVSQRDGKILVAGYFNNIAGFNRRFIARFNADMTLDTNFHNALFRSFSTNGPDAGVNDIALQADGKILIAGSFGSVMGLPNTRGVARLNPDGSVDDSFVSSVASFGSCAAVDVLPDGRILLFSGNGYAGLSSGLFRLSTNGIVDAGFTVTTDGSPTSLAVQPNGAILIGGTFRVINGKTNSLIARLIGNAQVDPTFQAPTNFTAYNQAVIRTIAIQENGKILAGGNFLSFGPFINGLARFSSDGTPDSSFVFQQGAGDDYNANVWKVSLMPDGRIAIGGRFPTWEGIPENGLAILNGDPVPLAFTSQPLDQFVSSGTTVQFKVSAIASSPIDYQWFRGATPLVDGGNISGALTPVLTVTGAGTAEVGLYSLRIFTPAGGTRFSLNAELYILGAPFFREQPFSATAYISNSISLRATVLGITPLSYQWMFNSNIIANATNLSLTITNLALANAGYYQLVASNGLGVVTSSTAALTIIPPPANLSSTWPHPAGANSGLYAVTPLGDGRVFVGGQFTLAGLNGNQTARVNLALLNANGTVDSAFNPTPDGRVNVIRRDVNGKILVGGQFNNIGGQPRANFARLNSDGSLDTAFLANLGSGPFQTVYDITLQTDGKILVVGSFATVSGQAYPNIVRLNADGTIDSTLKLNMQFAQQIQTIAVRNDGKIYVGGFLTVSNRQNLIRLESNGAVDLGFTGNVNSTVNRVLVTIDGGVVAGGAFTQVNSVNAGYLARFSTDGTLDTTWPQNRPNQTVQDMIFQPNGKLVVVGNFSAINTASRNQIARYNMDGSIDTIFLPGNGFGFSTPRSLALESDGRIWVAGNFTIYNGVTVNNLVLLVGDPYTAPVGGSPFQNWAASNGLNSGNNAPELDPDNDGISNIFEYYFGTSPSNGSSNIKPSSTSVSTGGQKYPAITFVRSKSAAGVSLISQASSSVTFSNSLGTVLDSTIDLGNGTEMVTIRSAVSSSVLPTQFLRIQLMLP